MELLSEVTINGNLHRVSTAWQTLENLWEPMVSSFTATKFGTAKKWGGYASAKWGNRSFSPDLFSSDWVPPATITVKDKLTDSDEASSITIFEGNLHLSNYDESTVNYNAYGEAFTSKETDAVYGDTLENIFATACGATKLNLVFDSTAARAISPGVAYTASGEKMLIDNLSEVAAFFSHAFYISGGTLYLVDMLLDNGASVLDEFGFFRGSEYSGATPYSLIKGGNYYKDGSYAYGTELDITPVCHNVQTNIESALADIKTIVEYEKYRFRVIPEVDQLPNIGQKITVINGSLQSLTTTWIRVTDISINISKSEILIEGFGASV